MKAFFAKHLATWERLKDWWFHLAEREKLALSIGGILLVIFIFYAGIWSPLANKAAALRKEIANNQAALVWMRATDQQLRVLESKTKQKAPGLTPVALLSVLKNKINEMKLTPYLTQLKEANQEAI